MAPNYKVIIGALKNMQEKLHRIEMEDKAIFEGKVNPLPSVDTKSEESSLYAAYPVNAHQMNQHTANNDDFFNDGYKANTNNNNNSKESSSLLNDHLNNIQAIDKKTVSTEKRVLELEKQLEKMRKLLDEETLVCCKNLQQKQQQHQHQQQSQVSPQSIEVDSTIQEFERIRPTRKSKSKKKAKRSKKEEIDQENASSNILSTRSKSVENSNLSKSSFNFTQQHYRLNLGDIPFVVGKSTGPSHHLGTNIQNVIALLKTHHPKICGSAHNSNECPISTSNSYNLKSSEGKSNRAERSKSRHTVKSAKCSINRSNSVHCHKTDSKRFDSNINNSIYSHEFVNESKLSEDNFSNTTASNIDFIELLRILQDEYTKLVLQHYDLTKKMIHCVDLNLRSELEAQAECIHKKMKIKARQINKLKCYQHQQQMIKQNKHEESVEFDDERPTRLANNYRLHSKESCYNTFHSAEYFGKIPNSQTHLRTLKLFKDIKNLQHKIQNDELSL